MPDFLHLLPLPATRNPPLNVPLTPRKKSGALQTYSNMKNKEKWQLHSHRYVEDVMMQLVQEIPEIAAEITTSEEELTDEYMKVIFPDDESTRAWTQDQA